MCCCGKLPSVLAPERRGFLLPLLLAAAFFCGTALADDSPKTKLDQIQRAIGESRGKQADFAKQAQALESEIAGLRQQSVTAAAAAQQHEAALTAIDQKLAQLNAEEQTKLGELNRHRDEQSVLLMALVQLARNPPEDLALAPGNPVDVLRGATLLGAAVPPVVERARALNAEVAALADLRRDIADTRQQQVTERDALVAEQQRISDIIGRKAELQAQAQQGLEDSKKREVQLALQARDLRELIEKLDADRAREEEAQRKADEQRKEAERRAAALAPPPAPTPSPPGEVVEVTAPPPVILDPSKPRKIRPFSEARGAMVYPASGSMTRRYGEPDEFGVASKGLSFETRPGAQVVAPFDGRVMFAGPFRGYGQILIISHDGGYHSLLAGLDRVDGSVGQWLVAGEPVGVMAGGTGKPRLYFELRRNNQPINPLPWLAHRNEKVSG